MIQEDQPLIPREHDKTMIDVVNSVLKPELNQDSLLSLEEASRYLRCSIVTFWKIRKEENLLPTIIHKRAYFRKSVIDKYLNKQKEVVNG